MPFTVVAGELAEQTKAEGFRQLGKSDVAGTDPLPMLRCLEAGTPWAAVPPPRSSRPVDLQKISSTNLPPYAPRAKPFNGTVWASVHGSEALAGEPTLGTVKARSG
jgi:hypothetical protein